VAVLGESDCAALPLSFVRVEIAAKLVVLHAVSSYTYRDIHIF
jgi:hypothetical protein